jgi:hypothetical protein
MDIGVKEIQYTDLCTVRGTGSKCFNHFSHAVGEGWTANNQILRKMEFNLYGVVCIWRVSQRLHKEVLPFTPN